MSGKQLDEHIRSMLKNYQVPFEPDHWDLFENAYEDQLEGDELLGDEMIGHLKQFEAEPIPGDWDVLSSMLDHEDAFEGGTFDTEIRKTVDRFEAPYEPNTWPILERKLTAAEIRRRRVIVTKILEVASILLLFITFYNFYPEIRTGIFNSTQTEKEKPGPFAEDYSSAVLHPAKAGKTQASSPASVYGPEAATQGSGSEAHAAAPVEMTAQNAVPRQVIHQDRILLPAAKLPPITSQLLSGKPMKPASAVIFEAPGDRDQTFAGQAIPEGPESTGSRDYKAITDAGSGKIPSLPLKLHVPLFDNLAHHKLYGAIQPVTHVKPSKRIGIYASTGVNVLHFPADNFYSGGEQITFNAQDLPALGYGGGISLGWFGRRFGFETGIQYSNKSFKPGRQLLIGESLENSKVDFQAVQIDLVTVPLTLTYQVKPTGKLRFYALGGFGFNLIAQAHYDLKIENNYPLPLSITQSASALASNREAHRIREHILDGATFKSKTHITAIVGFGLENYISHNLSLFVQPAYAHQIPLDRFSNNNGKNFKNLNIRLGARTTIH